MSRRRLGNYTTAQAANASRTDPTWHVREYLRARDASLNAPTSQPTQPLKISCGPQVREYLRARDGRGDFDTLKHEDGSWRPAADPAAMGTLGSNGMAAVRP